MLSRHSFRKGNSGYGDTPITRGGKANSCRLVSENVEYPRAGCDTLSLQSFVYPGAKLMLLKELLKSAESSQNAVRQDRCLLWPFANQSGRHNENILSERPSPTKDISSLGRIFDYVHNVAQIHDACAASLAVRCMYWIPTITMESGLPKTGDISTASTTIVR
jgi:hypothetical protein